LKTQYGWDLAGVCDWNRDSGSSFT